MTDWAEFAWAAAWAAALSLLPGYVWARLCRIPSSYALGVGPALTAGALGSAAVLLGAWGLPWHLGTAAVVILVVAGACALIGRRLAQSPVPHPPAIPMSRRARALSISAILGSVVIAVGPILRSMPGPDAILQRWDALFHLNALEHVRATRDGSSLTLGSLAFSDGRASFYPAAFHDIAALIPFASTPVTVNAAAMAMATIPWCTGLAVLVRALWPRLSWGPTAGAVLGALAPASPLNEWVHLSPTPNLVAFAALPGLSAMVLASWAALRKRRIPGPFHVAVVVGLILLGAAGIALLHPNVLVSLSLLIGVSTAIDLIGHRSTHPSRRALVPVPLLALAPTAVIIALPGSNVAQDFDGGLVVPWWQALGEVGLGLLTVWPMVLGIALWVLAWVGVRALIARRAWGLVLSAVVAAVLYVDAAVDSPLGLTVLWYRGQDRLAMLVTLLVVPLAVAGSAALAQWWRTRTRRPRAGWASSRLPLAAALLIAVAIAVGSVPTRTHQAALNLELDRSDRNRYFDTAEWELLKEIGPLLDPSRVLVASPFSGGAHLFAMSGQTVRFPTAGHALRDPDPAVIDAASQPDEDNCRILHRAGVGYVYVDARAYNFHPAYAPLQKARIDGLEPIAATDHSALYEVDCA